jgi:hypothetical protein
MDRLTEEVAATGPAQILRSMTCSDVKDVLAPALLSETVDLESSPHSHKQDRTYAFYSQAGIYINDLVKSRGVPVLSPLVLRIIYRGNRKDLKNGLLAAPIKGILKLDEEMGSTLGAYTTTGHPYERFHAQWEHLWRELHLRQGSAEKRHRSWHSTPRTRTRKVAAQCQTHQASRTSAFGSRRRSPCTN